LVECWYFGELRLATAVATARQGFYNESTTGLLTQLAASLHSIIPDMDIRLSLIPYSGILLSKTGIAAVLAIRCRIASKDGALARGKTHLTKIPAFDQVD